MCGLQRLLPTSERISVHMDNLSGSSGQFKNFRKDDFEADWIKVSECRFSQVYQVKLKLWREKCALKSFDTTFSKLKFKFIIFIYGLCSESTAVVMEYMCNGSLNDILASHNLMWPKKLQMIHEISMGMNFLHSMNPPLFHLNLKTSNILLDDHLHVKISDFGLIHWEEGMGKSFMEHLIERGNISYIPPETFAHNRSPPDYSFDVYSFGIIIWEILVQQKPYTVILHVSEGKRLCENLISHQRPTECDQMIDIMKLCWDQNPRKRPLFSGAETIIKANRNLVAELPTKYPHVGKRYKLKKITIILVPASNNEETMYKANGTNGIISLLTKKDFASFRQSVKREDVLMRFSGKRHLLHFTVAGGDLECVRQVLALGAEVNCATVRGYTPLIVAVLHRFHDIISLLWDYGANVSQGDEDQWMPLHFAAQNGDDKIVRILLDRGAVVDAREKAHWIRSTWPARTVMKTWFACYFPGLSEEAAIEWKEAQGKTTLHLLLLSQGADPNATDGLLNTPLHLAAEEGHYQVVRELMKNGAITENADSRGYTPLHLAALKGRRGICRKLLSSGASLESKTCQGWTSMHLAAFGGHEAAVLTQTLKRNSEGWTPLHLACTSVSFPSGMAVAKKTLLDSSGSTPLNEARVTINKFHLIFAIGFH
uniref:Ankyrin repeat and kinase domain containing 1 n=1 Tax=Gouania willdenowi TaxID=441366 RepID=A0A8C5DZT8_GOUWI